MLGDLYLERASNAHIDLRVPKTRRACSDVWGPNIRSCGLTRANAAAPGRQCLAFYRLIACGCRFGARRRKRVTAGQRVRMSFRHPQGPDGPTGRVRRDTRRTLGVSGPSTAQANCARRAPRPAEYTPFSSSATSSLGAPAGSKLEVQSTTEPLPSALT